MDELIPVFKNVSSADYADDTDNRKDSDQDSRITTDLDCGGFFYRVSEVGEQALLIRNGHWSRSLKRCRHGYVRHCILLLSFGLRLSHDVPE